MRVLLINSHPRQQRAFARMVRALRVETEISVATNLSETQALLECEGSVFDVAIVDLDCLGLTGVRRLNECYPTLTLLAFTFPDKSVDIHPGIARATLGLSVLVEHKGASTRAAPLRPATSSVSRLPKARPGREPQTEREETPVRLTPRQMDVLSLIAQGHSTKSIARQLDIAEGTVKVHTMAIFRELNVSNRTQAATKARDILQEPEDPDGDAREFRVKH